MWTASCLPRERPKWPGSFETTRAGGGRMRNWWLWRGFWAATRRRRRRAAWPTKAPQPGLVVVRTIVMELETSVVYSDVPLGDRAKLEEVVVDHYNIGIVRSFLRDYDVVEEFETLEAIDRLESEGT